MATKPRKLSKREAEVLRDIRLHFGQYPDRIVLLRNSVGCAKHFDEKRGIIREVPYGLGTGSPDLIGWLVPSGRVIGIECKREKGGKLSPDQILWGQRLQRGGGIWCCARSVDDVLAALGSEWTQP